MIITLDEAKTYLANIVDIANIDDFELKLKLEAIETMIREKTNNEFHDLRIRVTDRFIFNSLDNTIRGIDFLSVGFRVGNSIDIDNALQNGGVYTIEEATSEHIRLREPVVDEVEYAMITKVIYPKDIVLGVVKLLQYDYEMLGKANIKTETIGRYSVSYHDNSKAESNEGYPSHLLKFLHKYRKLRF